MLVLVPKVFVMLGVERKKKKTKKKKKKNNNSSNTLEMTPSLFTMNP